MSSLNLFPAHIPIGRFPGPNGRDVDVLATPEFFRALSAVFDRIGGSNGIANDELALFTILAPVASIAAPDIADLEVHGAEQSAQLHGLSAAMEEIRQLAASVSILSAEVQALRQAASSAEMSPSYQDQFRVNWERPGKIGSLTANTGAFTTLSASGQITSTLATGTAPLVVASVTKVANLNADLLDGTDWAAPGTIGGTTPASASFTTINASGQITSTLATGTAPMVIASATQVANLNVSKLVGATWVAPGAIGSTTPNTGAFTTLAATTVTASDQVTGTKTYSVAPAVKATTTATNLASTFASTNSDSSQFLVGYSGSSGDTSPAFWWPTGTGLRFATAGSIVAGGFTLRATIDANGMKVEAGLGCNGKTAQTAYALGAAATDLASVITLANNLQTMAVNNGMGS